MDLTAQEIHSALTATGKGYSATSWGGFNLFGDEASIKEAARLQHVADSAPARERALREEIAVWRDRYESERRDHETTMEQLDNTLLSDVQ